MPSRCFQGSCWKTFPVRVETLRNIKDFLNLKFIIKTRAELTVSFSQVCWLWPEKPFSKGIIKRGNGEVFVIQDKRNAKRNKIYM